MALLKPNSGDTVCINGHGDLYMDRTYMKLAGVNMVVVKQTKSGLWQLARQDDPNCVVSVPLSNIDIIGGLR